MHPMCVVHSTLYNCKDQSEESSVQFFRFYMVALIVESKLELKECSYYGAVQKYQVVLHFPRRCALADAQAAHGGNDEE